MATNQSVSAFGTLYADGSWREANIMCITEQHLKDASETIRTCEEELRLLIATFAVYGGRLTDIDRGDFDVDFFKYLRAKCIEIHHRLELLGHLLSSNAQKSEKVTTTYLGQAIRFRTTT